MVTFGNSRRVREHLERIAHLLQRRGSDLQIERGRALRHQIDGGTKQLL